MDCLKQSIDPQARKSKTKKTVGASCFFNAAQLKIIFLQINLTELLRAKAEKPAERLISNWSGRQDSNLRPTVPKTVALPGCATPRRNCLYIIKNDLKRPKG